MSATQDSTPEAAPQHTPGAMEDFIRGQIYRVQGKDVKTFNLERVCAFAREQDAIKELFRQALLHAHYRTHPHIPDGCDGCTAVEKAVKQATS